MMLNTYRVHYAWDAPNMTIGVVVESGKGKVVSRARSEGWVSPELRAAVLRLAQAPDTTGEVLFCFQCGSVEQMGFCWPECWYAWEAAAALAEKAD